MITRNKYPKLGEEYIDEVISSYKKELSNENLLELIKIKITIKFKRKKMKIQIKNFLR